MLHLGLRRPTVQEQMIETGQSVMTCHYCKLYDGTSLLLYVHTQNGLASARDADMPIRILYHRLTSSHAAISSGRPS